MLNEKIALEVLEVLVNGDKLNTFEFLKNENGYFLKDKLTEVAIFKGKNKIELMYDITSNYNDIYGPVGKMMKNIKEEIVETYKAMQKYKLMQKMEAEFSNKPTSKINKI